MDFLVAGSGEWKYVALAARTFPAKNKKIGTCEARSKRSDLVAFHAAIPLLDPYTNKFSRFAIVDVAVIVMLAVAEITGYFVSAPPQANCVVRGSIICITLGLHLLLIFKYRPVFSDRLTNYGTTVTDILSIVLIAGAMSISGGVDEEGGESGGADAWMDLAVALSMIQLGMTLMGLAGVILPWGCDRFFGKRKRKEAKKNNNDDNHEQNDMTNKKPKFNAKRKHNDSNIDSDANLSSAMMSNNNFSSSLHNRSDVDDESDEGLLMEMSVMPRHSPVDSQLRNKKKKSDHRKRNISFEFI